MLRTKQSDSIITMALLASFTALGVSCGARQEAPTTVSRTPVITKAESAPSQELRVVAQVALERAPTETPQLPADVQRAEALWAYMGLGDLGLEDSPSEVVQVSLQLGPKMAAHKFSIGLDGSVEAAELKQIRRLFRCRRTGRTHRINQGLLAKIADLSSHYDGRTIEVVSAYRHGANAKAGSRHRHGRAIDIKVDGVRAADVRDYLWGRYDEEVGVGFYRQQQFVHLDHRTNYPATAWTQKHHSAENTYKPRWARVAKRPTLVAAVAGLFQ